MRNAEAYLKQAFDKFDSDISGYTIIATGGFSSYSEYYEEIILEKDNLFWIASHGHSVMCSSEENVNVFSPDAISEEEAIQKMIEFDEEETRRELEEIAIELDCLD